MSPINDVSTSSTRVEEQDVEVEPMLQPDPTRFTMFPLKHLDLWDAYKSHMKAFWTEDEIDYTADKEDWLKLSDDERYFIEHILAFFAGSDGIVLENLIENFAREVQVPEARAFYAFQAMIENVHCVGANTRILTRDQGYVPIKEMVGMHVDVWNGAQWSNVKVVATGIDRLLRVTLDNGMYLDCTPDHEWVLADGKKRVRTKTLTLGDALIPASYPTPKPVTTEHDAVARKAYTNGFVSSYYMLSRLEYIEDRLVLSSAHKACIPRLERHVDTVGTVACDAVKTEFQVVGVDFDEQDIFQVPLNDDTLTKIEWLTGVYDHSGILYETFEYNESQPSTVVEQSMTLLVRDMAMAENMQLMLTTLGVYSSRVENVGRGVARLVIGSDGVCALRGLGMDMSRISRVGTVDLESTRRSTSPPVLKVRSIEAIDGMYDTYCFEEPQRHMGVFNGILAGQSTAYSLLIDTFVEDSDRKAQLFNAIETIPCVTSKAQWALKWIHGSERSFAERLVAFTVVEGIFFSGSFCAIFWLKSRGKMTRALGLSNEFIARDEGLHTDFGVLMYRKLRSKLSRERVLEIVTEAVEIERTFICDSLPCALIGMNKDLMYTYIQYVADRLLTQLGYTKHYNADNPFDFMSNIALSGKTNFFEKRTTEYQNASAVIKQSDKMFAVGDDDDDIDF